MSPYAIPPISGLNRIRVITVFVSLLLSWLAIALTDQPNNDAYTYVRAAEIALADGLPGAYAHYQWAHYSVLLAGIHALTGIPMFLAAQLLNTALFALLSVCFVNLVALMTPSRRVVWLAALMILVYPHVNEFRAYIIRDIGFIAFSLLAMVQLLRYSTTLRLRYGVCFVLACMAAALFRPEAIAFWLLTPLALLFSKEHNTAARRRAFFTVQTISVLAALALLGLSGLSGISLTQQLGVFREIYQPFADNISQLAGNNTYELSQVLYGDYAAQFIDEYTGYFLFIGLLAVLLICIIDSLGLAVAPVLLYGAIKRFWRLPAPATALLWAWLAVAFLILAGFILLTRFMTSRYVLLFCIVLLAWLPFIVDRAWSAAAAAGRQQRFAWVMGFVLLYATLDAHVSFGAARTHLDEATAWLEQNTRPEAVLITNEIRVAYQSGRVVEYDRVERQMDPVHILNAAPGSIIALTPRPIFQAVLDEQLASGQLRLLTQIPAERGGDFLIMEKDF